jgi:hypothetical protein
MAGQRERIDPELRSRWADTDRSFRLGRFNEDFTVFVIHDGVDFVTARDQADDFEWCEWCKENRGCDYRDGSCGVWS